MFDLVSMVTGIHPLELLVDLALGEAPAVGTTAAPRAGAVPTVGSAAVGFVVPPEAGTVVRVDGLDRLGADPGIVRWELPTPAVAVRPVDNEAYLGHVVTADAGGGARGRVEAALARLRLVMSDGRRLAPLAQADVSGAPRPRSFRQRPTGGAMRAGHDTTIPDVTINRGPAAAGGPDARDPVGSTARAARAPAGDRRGLAHPWLHERGHPPHGPSWPAITAFELGLAPGSASRRTSRRRAGRAAVRPRAAGPRPSSPVRPRGRLERWSRAALAAARATSTDIEDYWERGDGTGCPTTGPFHNTAVYGWDPLDRLLDAARSSKGARRRPPTTCSSSTVEHHDARAARPCSRAGHGGRQARSLDSVAAMGGGPRRRTRRDAGRRARRQQCARLGDRPRAEVDTGRVRHDDTDGAPGPRAATTCGVPRTSRADWADLVAALRTVEARHVIVATIPW